MYLRGCPESPAGMVGPWVDLRQRVAYFAVHMFHKHIKKADSWAWEGVKGRAEEWVDTANVVRLEVTGLCGFWDGSCEKGTCGARVMLLAFTKSLGWTPTHKKCGQVRVRTSLDAELCGCGVMWLHVSLSRKLHFSVVCLARGWTVTEPARPCGIGCAWECGSGHSSVKQHRFDCDQLVQTRIRRYILSLREMEDMLYGSVWCMINPLLTTDDAVMTRTVTSRWNVENR